MKTARGNHSQCVVDAQCHLLGRSLEWVEETYPLFGVRYDLGAGRVGGVGVGVGIFVGEGNAVGGGDGDFVEGAEDSRGIWRVGIICLGVVVLIVSVLEFGWTLDEEFEGEHHFVFFSV